MKIPDSGDFAGIYGIDPSTTTHEAGVLQAFSKLFDQVQWKRLTFEWVPTVGTTEGGNVIFGVDWDANVTKPDKAAKVAALTPNKVLAAYSSGTMAVNARQYQPQRWLRMHSSDGDADLAWLSVYATGPHGKQLGFIRIHYDVRFQGTRL